MKVETEFGEINVKVARLDGVVIKGMPEYEECRAAAERAGVPLLEVERAALASFSKSQGNG